MGCSTGVLGPVRQTGGTSSEADSSVRCGHYSEPAAAALFAALAIRGLEQEVGETLEREIPEEEVSEGEMDRLEQHVRAGALTRAHSHLRVIVESLSQLAEECGEISRCEHDEALRAVGEFSVLLARLGGGRPQCVERAVWAPQASMNVDGDREDVLYRFPIYDETFLWLVQLARTEATAVSNMPHRTCRLARLLAVERLEEYSMGLSICLEDSTIPVLELSDGSSTHDDPVGCMESHLEASRAAQVAMGLGQEAARAAAARLIELDLVAGMDSDLEGLTSSLNEVARAC
jgi:hypothetical protein